MAFAALERPVRPSWQNAALGLMRRALDALYIAAAYLAAASMVVILAITLAQIVLRYSGINIRGLSDYAGYFMASSAFLAFAHTLNHGVHVRIELILGMLGRFRRAMELLSFGASALIAGWFAWYACRMVYWSWKFGDISTGLDATPLWIPQSAMAVGAVLFAIAVVDQFLQLMFTGRHSMPSSESVE